MLKRFEMFPVNEEEKNMSIAKAAFTQMRFREWAPSAKACVHRW